MSDRHGTTRTVVKQRYALFAPESAVTSHLPGWQNAICVVKISPSLLGPRFTQLQITLEKEGTGKGNTGVNQYFIFVIEGSGTMDLGQKRHRLATGSYGYVPPGTDLVLKNSHAAAMKLLIFQKRYVPLKGVASPASIVAHEREIKPQPFLGNDRVKLQTLLPEHEAFDLAVNILTFQPGAGLPFVEAHVMEHGWLLVQGQGNCRLDQDHHAVSAGDVFWTGAYCPHWFEASGSEPARCIYYKDVNRDPS